MLITETRYFVILQHI